MTKKRSLRWLSALVAVVMCLGMLTVLPRGRFSPVEMMEADAAGVDNITARADYLYNITWTAKATVSGWNGEYTYTKGKTYHIPYGQPVTTGAYIYWEASIDKFLSSTQNASSVFYTTKSTYNGYTSTYYAMDCSAFVSYCWNLSSRTTTRSWSSLDVTSYGLCNSNNVSKIQQGDALNLAGTHVVLISRVNNDGTYEVTHQTPPEIKRSTMTASQLVSKYGSYTIYRYNKRGNVAAPPNKANTVTVNYNANGGIIAENDTYYAKSNGNIYRKSDDELSYQTWEYGSGREYGLMNASAYYLSREGYTFLGWSTSKSGGTIYDQYDASLIANDFFPDIATESGTVMMYAQWEKNTVIINYNTNGGTIAENDTYYAKSNGDIYRKSDDELSYQTWEYGSGREYGLMNASAYYLSREGYTFLGWSTSKSGGTIYDQYDATLIANDFFPDIATESGTVMMYAQWERNILTMNYNTNGGEIAENDLYYADDDGYICKKDGDVLFAAKWGYDYVAEKGLFDAATFKLSRPGYTFLGWSLSKSGGTVYSQTDNTIRAETLFPDIYTESGTVILYAQWQKNQIAGDVNLDGTISVLDVVALQKYLLAQYDFTEENFANADMTGDGSVNIFDLGCLKQYLLSL